MARILENSLIKSILKCFAFLGKAFTHLFLHSSVMGEQSAAARASLRLGSMLWEAWSRFWNFGVFLFERYFPGPGISK